MAHSVSQARSRHTISRAKLSLHCLPPGGPQGQTDRLRSPGPRERMQRWDLWAWFTSGASANSQSPVSISMLVLWGEGMNEWANVMTTWPAPWAQGCWGTLYHHTTGNSATNCLFMRLHFSLAIIFLKETLETGPH